MLGDAPRRAVRTKPQFGPLRQERRQLGFIPRLVEQHHVGLRLDPLGRDGGVDARGDAFENLSRLVGTLRLLRGGATKTHAEDGVEDEEGKFPSQAVAGARFGKVEGHAASKGPVELGPERVEDQVHLVEHERARGLEELDNLRGDGAFFSEFENLTAPSRRRRRRVPSDCDTPWRLRRAARGRPCDSPPPRPRAARRRIGRGDARTREI